MHRDPSVPEMHEALSPVRIHCSVLERAASITAAGPGVDVKICDAQSFLSCLHGKSCMDPREFGIPCFLLLINALPQIRAPFPVSVRCCSSPRVVTAKLPRARGHGPRG